MITKFLKDLNFRAPHIIHSVVRRLLSCDLAIILLAVPQTNPQSSTNQKHLFSHVINLHFNSCDLKSREIVTKL